jgi:hypothetical protein
MIRRRTLFASVLLCFWPAIGFAQTNEIEAFNKGLEAPSAQNRGRAQPSVAEPHKRAVAPKPARPSACDRARIIVRDATAAQARSQQTFQAQRAATDARTAICAYMRRDLPLFRRQSAAYAACPSLDADGSKRSHAERGVAGAISNMRQFSC